MNQVKLIISADTDPDSLFVIATDPASEKTAEEFMHREMMGDHMGITKRGTNIAKSGNKFGEVGKLAMFTGEEE